MDRGTERWEEDGRPGGEAGRLMYQEAARDIDEMPEPPATMVIDLDEIAATGNADRRVRRTDIQGMPERRTVTRLISLLPHAIVELKGP